MCRITIKELREVEELLISLLPPNKEDWLSSQRVLSDDLNFVISQFERFLNENKFEFDGDKFRGAHLCVYSALLDIEREKIFPISLQKRRQE